MSNYLIKADIAQKVVSKKTNLIIIIYYHY